MYAGDVVRVGVDCALILGCDMVGWWGKNLRVVVFSMVIFEDCEMMIV